MQAMARSAHANVVEYVKSIHTATADIKNHVVLLRVKPLHDLGRQFGDERSRILVGLESRVSGM